MSLGVCSYAGAIIGMHAREYLAALLTSETIEFGGIACVQIATTSETKKLLAAMISPAFSTIVLHGCSSIKRNECIPLLVQQLTRLLI